MEAEPEGKRERAGVYLTNALTGWEPPDEQKARLPFEEFEAEREEADRIKQREMILVVLGNPPYNAFAGVSPSEEDKLVEPYKEGLDYVRPRFSAMPPLQSLPHKRPQSQLN